jgi:multidrug efflux system membrane fusion protein
MKDRGEVVEAGELLVQLDRRDREAAVAQARATLEQRRIEDEGAQRLGQRGFQAETQVVGARAALEVARSNLRTAEIALGHTAIEAPFAGVLDTRPVELGTFVDVGDTIGDVVDLDPIIVVADVPEASIGRIHRAAWPRSASPTAAGTRAGALRRPPGERADPHLPHRGRDGQPGLRGAAGVSTELRIRLEPVPAHPVSPGILVLADDGALGIKSVNGASVVEFHEADIVRAAVDTVWLGGLPDRLRIITVGQGFVEAGQRVAPTDEGAVAAILENGAGDGRGAP